MITDIDPYEIFQRKSLQPRTEVHQDTVRAYTDIYRADGPTALPPLTVYVDADGDHQLIDGWHRRAAAIAAELETVPVTVIECDPSDALMHAIRANAQHGLPLSNADKRRCVEMLIDSGSIEDMSARKVARLVGCSHDLVARIRKELAAPVDVDARADPGSMDFKEQSNESFDQPELEMEVSQENNDVEIKEQERVSDDDDEWDDERDVSYNPLASEAAPDPVRQMREYLAERISDHPHTERVPLHAWIGIACCNGLTTGDYSWDMVADPADAEKAFIEQATVDLVESLTCSWVDGRHVPPFQQIAEWWGIDWDTACIHTGYQMVEQS